MKLPFVVFIRIDSRSSAVSKHYINISNNTKNYSITGWVFCESVTNLAHAHVLFRMTENRA